MDCVRDIIAISGLVIRVHLAYKDVLWGDFGYILEDIAALQVLIDKVAQHFKSTTTSNGDHHDGQRILKGCQSVLEDLNAFIEKYRRLASVNKSLVINRVKLGKNDITVLHARLISNTGLLTGFVRRCVVCFCSINLILISLPSCQCMEIQVQLAALLGLQIPVKSIISLIANTNVKTAYRQFCKDLSQIGVTEDMVRQKEDQILKILKSQGIIASSQIGSDNDQELEKAYLEYCKHLYEIGFTEDVIPPRARILEILESRGVVARSQSDDRNTEHDTKTEDEGQLGCSLFRYDMSTY